MEIFGAICSADQLEITQAGIVQTETATVMMMFAHLQHVNDLFYFAM